MSDQQEKDAPYYKREGLTKIGCWVRFRCDWCGKKIVGDGSDNGFKCSDPECESNIKIPLTDNEKKGVHRMLFFIFTAIGLISLILFFGKLKRIEEKKLSNK